MADNKSKLHIAMFPWSGFGHMITFLELAKAIARKGHKVSFISTTKNIHRLQNITNVSSLDITFVNFNLPKVDGLLPEGAEATMDMPGDAIPYLMKALDGLKPDLTRFLESESPDWIIYDSITYWVPEIAATLGISCAYFSIFTAWFLASTGSSPDDMINNSDVRSTPENWLVSPPWVNFPTKVALKAHELEGLKESISKDNPSGLSMMYRAGTVFKGSDVIFIRHCMEFAPEWISVLEKIHQKPVIPVGLLPPSVQDGRGNHDNNETWLTIKKWLDTQNNGSVLYVALGSEVPLSEYQLTELALGLELSGLPFFWALRKSSSSAELPNGFLERTKSQGKVWTSWAPQLNIVGHDSVGGFLSHSGWGSVIEGLTFGKPLILLPFYWEQGLNARLLVEKNVGVEVARNEVDGSFTRKSVAESVGLVMVEEEGRMYKERAKEFMGNGDKELHDQYIDNVVNHLQIHRAAAKAKFEKVV